MRFSPILFSIAAPLLLPLAGSAEEAPAAPELSADEPIEINTEARTLRAKGNAELTYDSWLLRSDDVFFDRGSGLIEATGNTAINYEGLRVITDSAEYRWLERAYSAETFRLGHTPLLLEGKRVEGEPGRVLVEDATLFFAEPDFWALSISADRATVEKEESVSLESAVFKLGPVPVFFLPDYSQSLGSRAPLNWKIYGGSSNQLGTYIQNEVIVRTRKPVRFGANADFYSERGFLAGPIVEYGDFRELGEVAVGTIGHFSAGLIKDSGSRSRLGVDVLNRPIDDNRHFIEWDHRQEFAGKVDLFGNLSLWSDSEMTRDFRPEIFGQNQRPDTFAQLTYRGFDYTAELFGRFQPNDYQRIVQRLPEVSFTWLPSKLGETGLLHRFNASYVNLLEKDPVGIAADRESERLNAYYGLLRPIPLAEGMTFTPVVGTMVTHYADANGGGSYTRALGEFGFDFEGLATGVWEIESSIWGINGLRHRLQPVIQYRFIPDAQKGQNEIPRIDRRAPVGTYLEPLGLPERRSIDDLYETNTLRLGLENVLQTRHEDYGSRELMRLDFYQDLQFEERPDEEFFSNFFTSLELNPAYWLALNLNTAIDPNDGDWEEVRAGATVVDGDRWSLYLGNHYFNTRPYTDFYGNTATIERLNQYAVDARFRLNHRNALLASWRIDAKENRFNEQAYGWQTQLGNSWLAEFQLRWTEGSTRESNDLEFRVRFELLVF